MAMLNGGRMVALFVSVLFALNVSFAQDRRTTVVVYIEDPVPVSELLAPQAKAYLDKLNDPFTWETEQDFQDARDAQIDQVEANNNRRKQEALRILQNDMSERGNGTSSWYPSVFPLRGLPGDTPSSADSLFKNAINHRWGRSYVTGPQTGIRQSLREFILRGEEPYADSSTGFRSCDPGKPRCRNELLAEFSVLIQTYDFSLVQPTPYSMPPDLLFPALIWPDLLFPAVPPSPSLLLPDASETLPSEIISPIADPRIISLTIEAADSSIIPPEEIDGYVDELNEEGTQGQPIAGVAFDWGTIRLLQEAEIDPDALSFHVRPAAKPVSSSETSSWGRIKETFAD